jgi:hypothetical protein
MIRNEFSRTENYRVEYERTSKDDLPHTVRKDLRKHIADVRTPIKVDILVASIYRVCHSNDISHSCYSTDARSKDQQLNSTMR